MIGYNIQEIFIMKLKSVKKSFRKYINLNSYNYNIKDTLLSKIRWKIDSNMDFITLNMHKGFYNETQIR